MYPSSFLPLLDIGRPSVEVWQVSLAHFWLEMHFLSLSVTPSSLPLLPLFWHLAVPFWKQHSQTHLLIIPEMAYIWEVIFPLGQNLKESTEHLLFFPHFCIRNYEIMSSQLQRNKKKTLLDRIYSLVKYHQRKTYLEVRLHKNRHPFVFWCFCYTGAMDLYTILNLFFIGQDWHTLVPFITPQFWQKRRKFLLVWTAVWS